MFRVFRSWKTWLAMPKMLPGGGLACGTQRSSNVSTDGQNDTGRELRRRGRERDFNARSQEGANMMENLPAEGGLRYNAATAPGAQTVRPGAARPVRALLGGWAPRALSFPTEFRFAEPARPAPLRPCFSS